MSHRLSVVALFRNLWAWIGVLLAEVVYPREVGGEVDPYSREALDSAAKRWAHRVQREVEQDWRTYEQPLPSRKNLLGEPICTGQEKKSNDSAPDKNVVQ